MLGGGDEERARGRLLVEREGLDLVQPGEREEARKLPGDRARSDDGDGRALERADRRRRCRGAHHAAANAAAALAG